MTDSEYQLAVERDELLRQVASLREERERWRRLPTPLADAERAAIDRARRAFRDMDHNAMTMQQVEDYEALCGLLERHGTTGSEE